MANLNYQLGSSFIFLLLQLLLQFHSGKSDLELNYYRHSCPRAEEIVKEQVTNLYNEHGNTAVSWIRTLFHDCIVQSCDASLLLDTANGVESEKSSSRSFGMRNFKYIDTIKSAVERECPNTVSCADIVALSARDGAALLGGPYMPMMTGRRDSTQSYLADVEKFIPNINDSNSLVLSAFQSVGIDTEGTAALIGAHSVGRTHCESLTNRLYPSVDPSMDPSFANYLMRRCPLENHKQNGVEYSRNDLVTPMVLDNNYYKNLLKGRGLLVVDQQLVNDQRTYPFVANMAKNNSYFLEQFSRAFLMLSENNPLTGVEGEIRKDCRFVNRS